MEAMGYLAAFTASAFRCASHSSGDKPPAAFGQYLLPRYCVCPNPAIMEPFETLSHRLK